MKGYIRLRDPEEEFFLGEGAGYYRMDDGGGEVHYRAFDRSGLLIVFPASRLVTARLGPGNRPPNFEPVVEEPSWASDKDYGVSK